MKGYNTVWPKAKVGREDTEINKRKCWPGDGKWPNATKDQTRRPSATRWRTHLTPLPLITSPYCGRPSQFRASTLVLVLPLLAVTTNLPNFG